MSDSSRPHVPQHARHPCPSPTPGLCSDSPPLSDAIQPCHPLLLLPSISPSYIRAFSKESALHIRWPRYWSFSFNISPSNEHPGLVSFRMDCLDLLAVQGTHQPGPQFKNINSLALSSLHNPTLTSIHDHWKNHSLD